MNSSSAAIAGQAKSGSGAASSQKSLVLNNGNALMQAQARPAVMSMVLGKDMPVLVSIQSQRQWYQEPAIYVSVIAILVSVLSLAVNLRVAKKKDKKARVQSIQDEFWLRKVLYPLAIEPALEYYAQMLSSSPADRFDPSSTSQAIADFKNDFEQQHSAIVAKNVTLGILGQSFFDSVKAELEYIEDLVTEYCFHNSSGYDQNALDLAVATRASFEVQVSAHLVAIMKSIRKLQETIE